MDQLNRTRWRTLVNLGGPNDCVPVAISLVENLRFDLVKARCWFYNKSHTGYPLAVISWVRGSPLRRIDRVPQKGYARYSATSTAVAHVAPILNGHLFIDRDYQGVTPEYYV